MQEKRTTGIHLHGGTLTFLSPPSDSGYERSHLRFIREGSSPPKKVKCPQHHPPSSSLTPKVNCWLKANIMPADAGLEFPKNDTFPLLTVWLHSHTVWEFSCVTVRQLPAFQRQFQKQQPYWQKVQHLSITHLCISQKWASLAHRRVSEAFHSFTASSRVNKTWRPLTQHWRLR